MNIRPDTPDTRIAAPDPRIEAEWRRQEAARAVTAGTGPMTGDQDRLYAALARAAALPAPALPAGFATRLQ